MKISMKEENDDYKIKIVVKECSVKEELKNTYSGFGLYGRVILFSKWLAFFFITVYSGYISPTT